MDPLLARRSVSIAASATVLGELQRRWATAPQELVAFGDPGARPVEPLQAASAVALRSGTDLGPLPWSRTEVESLGRLFGERAQIFLDDDGTEERLVSAGPTALRLHLACHAVVDPLLPLESGLVLAPDGEGGEPGNGFLQVWEIYQGLRLDADLVTLSACQTALGRELTGEGVLGLTRAFHYAGRSSSSCGAGRDRGRSRPVPPLLLGRLPGPRRLGLTGRGGGHGVAHRPQPAIPPATRRPSSISSSPLCSSMSCSRSTSRASRTNESSPSNEGRPPAHHTLETP